MGLVLPREMSALLIKYNVDVVFFSELSCCLFILEAHYDIYQTHIYY